mmetsp:Transcript_44278/g.93034  ORF Transcript_44278/g.93034 Transcript_44278/m.93034 type:complete len:230 (-) Transcript_44278:160-849(-)
MPPATISPSRATHPKVWHIPTPSSPPRLRYTTHRATMRGAHGRFHTSGPRYKVFVAVHASNNGSNYHSHPAPSSPCNRRDRTPNGAPCVRPHRPRCTFPDRHPPGVESPWDPHRIPRRCGGASGPWHLGREARPFHGEVSFATFAPRWRGERRIPIWRGARSSRPCDIRAFWASFPISFERPRGWTGRLFGMNAIVACRFDLRRARVVGLVVWLRVGFASYFGVVGSTF